MQKFYFLISCSFLIFSNTLWAQENLQGKWKGTFSTDYQETPLSWNLTEGGFELDMNADGSVEVSGRWKVEGGQLIVWDTGGPMACDDSVKGLFDYRVKENILKLTLVEDNCPGRKMIMPAVEWRREE